MDRTLRVRTPESIAFSYELAGLGSRFLAMSIDLIIQILLAIGIFWGLFYAALNTPIVRHASVVAKTAESVTLAIVSFIVFLIFFGYFIIFEAYWNGQTPGKKLLALRVVRDGGYPVDFASAAVRNLIRVGELIFGFYLTSAVAALLSPENKRLGDMAAGTIVVRDARSAALAQITGESHAQAPHFAMLDDDESALIDRFVARRDGMAPGNRAAMAAQIAARVRPRVSRDLQQLSDEELLTRLSAS
ncbi:MAG TPA: RDD family protein [Candidatus Rubrimentiphilum sp.]|nr:RDD family protein [Candidatus Rubrimentiphilum sp.]